MKIPGFEVIIVADFFQLKAELNKAGMDLLYDRGARWFKVVIEGSDGKSVYNDNTQLFSNTTLFCHSKLDGIKLWLQGYKDGKENKCGVVQV